MGVRYSFDRTNTHADFALPPYVHAPGQELYPLSKCACTIKLDAAALAALRAEHDGSLLLGTDACKRL